MSKIPTLIALVTLTVVSAPPLHAAVPEPIRVETGLVSGVPGAFREVRVFKGLPFAEPPVGGQAMGISAAPGMIPVPNTGALDFLDGYAKRAQPSPVSRPSAGR